MRSRDQRFSFFSVTRAGATVGGLKACDDVRVTVTAAQAVKPVTGGVRDVQSRAGSGANLTHWQVTELEI
jgi:hypothetical protein